MASSEQLTLGFAPDSPTRDVDTDDLPAGWTIRVLGDLVTVMGGGTPSKGNPAYWDGSIPWVSPKDMKSFELFDSQDHITAQAVAESPVKRIAPNSVLVVFRSGILAHTLPVAINRAPVTLNQDMKALTPRGEVSCDYLAYYLRSAQRDILDAAKKKGATVESIDADAFLRTPVSFPALPEQRRIVARIEELAAKIEQARGLRREVMQEINSILISATDIAFSPKPAWTEMRVGDFCEKPQYGFTESATIEPIGPKFLRITDIQDGQVNWSTVPFCRCPSPQQYLLRQGDLVFARTGATTGKSFVIRDCPEAIFASYLIRLRVKRVVSVDYLYRYFQSSAYWQQIAHKAVGSGQPNLNGTKLASIRVPIAPPREQARIVDYLNNTETKVEALRRLQAESAVELNALLPAVLARAFRGEL